MNSRIFACVALAATAFWGGCASDDDSDSGPAPVDAVSDSRGEDANGGDTSADSTSDGSTIGADASADTHADADVHVDVEDTSDVDTGAWADDILTVQELFDGNLIDSILIEVDFEEGAEPHNGSGSLDWGYIRDSLARVFKISGATVALPTRLNELESFVVDDETIGDAYSTEEIRSLSFAYRNGEGYGTIADFHVLYLDGFYEVDGQEQPEILGVSVGRERLIALFKPALESVKTVSSTQRGFVEEATLLHELGHSFGLVGLPLGVPMVEDHEDPEHPGHDVDDECVMYWRNERASDLLNYVVSMLIGSESQVLFCDASLRDIDAISAAPLP